MHILDHYTGPRHDRPRRREEDVFVEKARQHDEAAIRAIIQRYNQTIFRMVRAIVQSDAEAEDVVQEAYVRAFSNLESFRGDAAFGTWLIRIALNEALGRKRQRRETDLSALETSPSVDVMMEAFGMGHSPVNPESDAARAEIRALIETALDTLPEVFRIVFVMRDVEGFDIAETAALLELNPNTVKTRLFRARAMLREALSARVSPYFGDLFPFDGARCADMADRVLARL